MINSEYVEMLEHKDIIFELAAYANQRRAEVGPENVFDFSLGGPSVPPPIEVHQALQELIEEGRMTMAQISREVGCCDESHFNRKFREQFGMSPSKYKSQRTES